MLEDPHLLKCEALDSDESAVEDPLSVTRTEFCQILRKMGKDQLPDQVSCCDSLTDD